MIKTNGDVPIPRELGDTLYPSERERYIQQFPNSIATQYIVAKRNTMGTMSGVTGIQMKQTKVDYALLHNLISKRPGTPIKANVIAIHCRLGDVCVYPDVRVGRIQTPEEILANGITTGNGFYMHPFAHYAQTVNRLKAVAKAKGASVSVVLVTGSHLKDEHIARLGLAQERTTERVLKNRPSFY